MNWKAIGYIFLEFRFVFLGVALLATLSKIAINPTPSDVSTFTLVASATCLLAPKNFFSESTIMLSESVESASTRIGDCFCEETD